MFKFGGEKYSKEAFEAAQASEAETRSTYEKVGRISPFLRAGESEGIYNMLEKDQRAAKKKLESLMAAGQTEATKLNEEYDRLIKQFQEAYRELETFSKEKLGMSYEEEDESAE